ncbi:MAG: D-alanyl-D-alanine carboxypeptidase/D-alanyl-D-alanine-endopeptidase [Ilumatobacteraceae bacterium]
MTSSVRRRGPRGPGPWIVLVVIALVPALALFAVVQWSSGQQDDNEAAPMPDPSVGAAAPTPELSTALMTLRRMPTVVSREVNADAFVAEVTPFLGLVNDRSCAAISVDGQLVSAHNLELPVIPASNEKLPVAAAALERLGEDYRYTTSVVVPAEPVDGVIAGDLFLVGGGDPLLSSDWYPESNLDRYPVLSPTSLDTLADSVVAAGVDAVTGNIVGDGTRYDDEFFAPGWGVGVQGLEGGPYDALLVNDARVLGEDLRASDPNEGGAREFARLLSERGVEISGSAVSGAAPASAVEIASIDSAPMSAVVGELLANSDNNTAELLVKELGFAESAMGTREAGLAVVRELLVEWGVDVTSIVLADGSGLSLDNRLTCDALITVLQRTGPVTPVGTGLPVAGESGTLRDIFTDHAVAGRLLAKTGTLNNPPFNVDPPAVKALAGYLPVDGGGAVEFVLVLNGPTISDQSEYRPLWNALADTLATYPAGPTPATVGPR